MAEHLHPSDAGRRLLPVFWGTASVVALGSLVARRAGRASGLLAALFLALAPFHVRYSQEFRPYSLGIFLLLVSLVCLERWLDRPGLFRVCALYFSCLATAYTLYVATIALGIASAGLLIEDAVSGRAERLRHARRFLMLSPGFIGLLWVGYLPWLPVVREAARRAPFARAPEMSIARLTRVLAFFSFAPNEGYPLSSMGIVYVALVVVGILVTLGRKHLRFLSIWAIGASVVVETLEHLHPHYFVPRHFLPAAVTFPIFAALSVSWLGRRNLLRFLIAGGVIAALLIGDVRGLSEYFRVGRPDWRPLANYLRRQPIDERVLTENGYVQLCLGYYLVGPNWLRTGAAERRSVVSVSGDPGNFSWMWESDKKAWLVLINAGNQSDTVKKWAEPYPSIPFPTAEGGAVLKRLVH